MLITAGAEPFRSGVDFVQVREPALEARALARLVRAWIAAGNARVLVNDRTDVAIASGAAGVHLRDRSISPELIRRIAPPGFVITAACHDAEGVLRAADEGADYAVLAPVFAPLSKSSSAPPLGLDALRSIASKSRIPVIALGGITAQNVPQCMDAGAAGVAGITLFRR
ncbi:MAG TPA: thiamine phosphate synthase [Bryobacteraceae bacterium]|nr:thiamine phosphate synthase [Bryobacteraceae bacterium]